MPLSMGGRCHDEPHDRAGRAQEGDAPVEGPHSTDHPRKSDLPRKMRLPGS